ncbi:Zinc finger protein-like 1 [Taenia solium]|eukprot:TsM_000418600 transcript=TsM_000418600 gene=TsM_000418600
MGLCKCKRKKVTTLFCFEHRVNVCEFCLVANHPKCVVKSYLHWLKDSDYSSQCPLCSKELDNGEECIRLLCLDIFHWQCLDNYASQLPETTTPAGYVCPSCSMCMIPPANQGGPVAEVLRHKILSAKWAKPNRQRKAAASKAKAAIQPKANKTLAVFDDSKLLDTSVDTYASQFLRDQEMVTPPMAPPKPVETVVPIEHPTIDASSISRLEYKGSCSDDSKQAFQKFTNPRNLVVDDEDADKYRRHSVAAFNPNGRFDALHLLDPTAASLPAKSALRIWPRCSHLLRDNTSYKPVRHSLTPGRHPVACPTPPPRWCVTQSTDTNPLFDCDSLN